MTNPSPREVQRALSAELLAALRHQAQTQTDFLERLAGQIINNVLEVWSGIFDATGVMSRDYNVAAGCIYVANLGVAGHLITVSSAAPGAVAPSGTGTFLIDGGTARTVPLASRNLTLYGTAADRVAFAVFTAPPRPVL